jgi:hypothetical protein
MPEDYRLGNTGSLRDLLCRSPPEPFFRKQLDRYANNLLAPLIASHPASYMQMPFGAYQFFLLHQS